MKNNLISFLKDSLTTYHACENEKNLLLQNGFVALPETEDWNIEEGGKYFVTRGGALVAFTVDSLDEFTYKIATAHNDSPCLKLKENPVTVTEKYGKLNVEKYGGGLWYSFLDRPLKIAGRVMRKTEDGVRAETVEAPFLVTIPSVAIHQNRSANEGFTVNVQTDMLPLCALMGDDFSAQDLLEKVVGENAVAYDLFLCSAENPYEFGANNEFLAAPRIDNLASGYAALRSLISHEAGQGICVAALLNHEEIGSRAFDGADCDFLNNVLRRIAYALRFDDNEYYKALASSFLVSADNAHAVHPNHPEKCDPTNRPCLGSGVLIKGHASGAYVTEALSAAVLKTIFEKASVPHQYFYNRSDVASGSTLAGMAVRYVSIPGADIGIPQLAMHSACECIAYTDYEALEKGLNAYYASAITINGDDVVIK